MGKDVHWRVDIEPLFMARDSNEHIVHEMSWQRGQLSTWRADKRAVVHGACCLWVVFQCVYCSGPWDEKSTGELYMRRDVKPKERQTSPSEQRTSPSGQQVWGHLVTSVHWWIYEKITFKSVNFWNLLIAYFRESLTVLTFRLPYLLDMWQKLGC